MTTPTLAVGARRAAVALTLALAACASGDGIKRAKPLPLERVPKALAEAEATLEQGPAAPLRALEKAVDELRSARVTPLVDRELSRRVQVALERAAADLVERAEDPDTLKDLIETELPMRFAAAAGVRAAELELEDGERMAAFKTIRALDRRYPTHTQRDAAGELLARAGFSLADDRGRYLLFFRYRSLAPQVLEYLALEYPSHPQADDALARLAEIYEGRRLWSDAIAKHQELVLWAPDSPFRIESEADIPRLRLAALRRPDVARDNLLQARDELVRWLSSHPGHPLTPDVERHLVDARQRLADNDLTVARFYLTTASAQGVRFHALRAEAEARLAGNPEQVAEAEALLAKAVTIPAPVPVEGAGASEAPREPRGDIFGERGGS